MGVTTVPGSSQDGHLGPPGRRRGRLRRLRAAATDEPGASDARGAAGAAAGSAGGAGRQWKSRGNHWGKPWLSMTTGGYHWAYYLILLV